MLRVKVRGATTVHWVKNDIAIKEGADGGRITGVATDQLLITHLLGRDAGHREVGSRTDPAARAVLASTFLEKKRGEKKERRLLRCVHIKPEPVSDD